MKQTNRIKHLYKRLMSAKHSYNELLSYFEKMNVSIGLRQLQRDIKDLELFLVKDERLIKSRTKGNVLELQVIKQDSTKDQLHIVKSGFKTPVNHKEFDERLKFFTDAITQNLPIRIHKLKNDATSFNAEFKDISFSLFPLQIIYHHSDYYLGCYITKTNEYAIFEINQLVNYKLSKKSNKYDYNKLLLGFNTYAKGLFGVTKNVDDNIYRIKLEFSSVTGAYVENFVWHHSQKIKRQDNKVIMTLRCGINRELLRWIFSWMYNVRIIEPPELKVYYNRTLKEIQQINYNIPLVYRNIFG